MAEIVYTSRYYPAALAERAIDIVVGLMELLIALRFVLELLDAGAGSSFVGWIYNASETLVAPFQGAFPSIVLSGGYVIDLSAVLAMIAYAIIGWLIIRLVAFVFNSA